MKALTLFFTLLLTLTLATTKSFASQAPDFSLLTAAGQQVSLQDFKGQGIVIHFWATWCPYCKKLQPELNRLATKYQEKGVNVIAISIWEDEGAAPQQVIDERGHQFITLINGDNVAERYQVKGTPTTLFVDRSGEIIWASSASEPTLPAWQQAFEAIAN